MNFWMKKVVLFTVLIFTAVFAKSQGVERLVEQETNYLIIADSLFNQNRFIEAIEFLEKASQHRVNRKNPVLIKKLADCYRLARKYDTAVNYYDQLLEKAPDKYPDAAYWKGRMLQSMGDYQKAYQQFEDYRSTADRSFDQEAQLGMEACAFAIEKQLEPHQQTIDELTIKGVQSPSYYGGFVLDDKIWMSASIRIKGEKKLQIQEVSGLYDQYYVDRLYFASLNSDGSTNQGKVVENLFYKLDHNYLPPTFSPDQQNVFFSICPKKINSLCQVRYGDYISGKISNIRSMKSPVNKQADGFSSRDPMVTLIDSQLVMFYASGQPDGSGRHDIWYALLDQELQPTEAHPLKGDINTVMDEVSPFYDPEKERLYFASEGHPGLGNYDVFYVQGSPFDGWGKVINAGRPMNSRFDDYYYAESKRYEETMSYVSSNRHGSHCCDKVYKVNWLFEEIEMIVSVFDNETKKPIDKTRIILYEDEHPVNILNTGDNHKAAMNLYQNRPYKMNVVRKPYDTATMSFVIDGNNRVFEKKVYLDKQIEEQKGDEEKSKADKQDEITQKEGLYLPTVYYGFNEALISENQKNKLRELASMLIKEYPEKFVVVASHTDNIDQRSYNMTLSKKRTMAVIDFLQQKGVERERIFGQWYGEERPAAPNQHPDGRDYPEGRKKNRRTEFIVFDDSSGISTGQMVQFSEESATASFSEQKSEFRADSKVMNTIKNKYGDDTARDLSFNIQIGAFLHASRYYDARMENYAEIEKALNVEIFEEKGEKFTRYLMKGPATLNEVLSLKKKLRNFGLNNSFIVPYYKDKRISLVDAIELFGTKN